MLGKGDYGDYPTGDMKGWEWVFGLGGKVAGSSKNQEIMFYCGLPGGGIQAGAGVFPNGVRDDEFGGPAYKVGDWIYVVGRMDSSHIYQDIYYVSGSQVIHLADGSTDFTSYTGDGWVNEDLSPSNTASGLHIGTIPTQMQMFEGVIDEVRVSNVFRSDAWLKTSYYSERDGLLSYSF